jgi:hypothetical protein
MSTANDYRRVAWHYLKLAEVTSDPKRGASLLNLAGYWAKRADECAARAQSISDPERRANMLRFAGLWLSLTEAAKEELPGAHEWPRQRAAAAAVIVLLFAGTSVFAADGMSQDDVCAGSKPFREVAQDESRTMAELCAIQEERLREDRGWKDTPPVAWRNGELRNGWAQGGNIQMRKR